MMLDPRLGLINTTLRAIGLPGPGWLRSAAWAKPALIMTFDYMSVQGRTKS